jgi:hypothetical protein
VTPQLQTAKELARDDLVEGWAAFDDIFRAGEAPSEPLDGRYRGELVGLRIAPGVTQAVNALTRRWLPWKGKRFDAATRQGDNIFTRDSIRISRVIWPVYSDYVADSGDTYRAFRFQTRMDAGLLDRDRKVFVLDYDLAGNPPFNIRRIRDELIQLEDRSYLGKAHVHWYWGKWQTVAYFSLTDDNV